MTVQQIYNRTIKPLPAADRLKLAKLILNEIPPQSQMDFSEGWADEDLQDITCLLSP